MQEQARLSCVWGFPPVMFWLRALNKEEKPAPLCLAMLPLSSFFEKARLWVCVHSSSVRLGNRSEMDSDQRDVLPFISDFADSLSQFINLKRSTFLFFLKHLFPQTNKAGMLSACLLGSPSLAPSKYYFVAK